MGRGRCELGALPKTTFGMLVVPSPENEDVEAVWTAPWAYYSWAYYCQLLLRRARRLWRLHISEQWLTARLARLRAIADPAVDPADPVALVRLARARPALMPPALARDRLPFGGLG